MNRLLNVSQAANFLGVSAASVRNWSDAGLLLTYRTPGGQRRYSLDELEEFLWSMREAVIRRGQRSGGNVVGLGRLEAARSRSRPGSSAAGVAA